MQFGRFSKSLNRISSSAVIQVYPHNGTPDIKRLPLQIIYNHIYIKLFYE